MPVKPVPDNEPVIVPYLTVNDAAKAIGFYRHAFGADIMLSLKMPDGRIGHAQLKIGSGIFMLADAFPEMGFEAPKQGSPYPVTIYLYVEDIDAFFEKATAAGAVIEKAIEDQFYGDRTGRLTDPFGHKWYIATRIKDIPFDEMQGLLDAECAKTGG